MDTWKLYTKNISRRLHRIMLSRRTSASTNQDALREITTANGYIRRAKRIEAERLFRHVLTRYRHGRTPGDIQALVDAFVGLCDASVSASRQHTKLPIEQFWFLVRGLCFLRRAKDLLKAQFDQQAKASVTYDGLQSKTRNVHAEAYALLERALLGRSSAQSQATVGRLGNRLLRRDLPIRRKKDVKKTQEEDGDGSFSLEERGRNFLEEFFNLCASAERRRELRRDPGRQLPDFTARLNPAQDPKKRLRWLHGASPVSASMMDLTCIEPEPSRPVVIEEPEEGEEDEETALTPVSIHEQVQGTIGNLRERFGMPLSSFNAEPGDRDQERLSEIVRDQKRRIAFMTSQEAHHLIEYEAENIVTNLKSRRSVGGLSAGSKLRRAASMIDTRSAGMSMGEAAEEDGGNRRGETSAAVLRRRSARRLQRSASREALNGALSMSCLALDEAVQVCYQSPSAKYRQMRQQWEALGMEECHVEEVEEDEESEEAQKDREEEREEPEIPQLHAEWIHTLVHFANRLDVDDDAEAASVVFGHALFLYEMLERDVVEMELMAYVMRRLGAIRCHQGNLSGGISLMERALAIYADLPNADSAMMEQAGVWLEMGNAHLHGVRGLHLAHQAISMAVRRHVNQENMRPEDKLLGEAAEEKMLQEVSKNGDSEKENSIASNSRQAFSCYKRCLAMLEHIPKEVQPRGFRVRLLTRLGDCNLVLGDSEKATDFYEKAQELFSTTDTSGLIEENAHVLCMLGIGRFLSANYSKALAVLETAYVILYHRSMDETVRTGQAPAKDSRYFVTALLALCYARTEHRYKTLNWCNRSLAFAKLLFGEDMSGIQEENDAWLLAQVLMVHGNILGYFARNEEAVESYLSAISLVDAKLEGDAYLRSCLHRLIGDNFRARGKLGEALNNYQQAAEILDSFNDPETFGVSFQKAKLFSTLGNTLVDLERQQEGSSFLNQSESLQCSLQDELTSSVVALQYQMAVNALHNCDHDRAFKLLSEALKTYREEHDRLGADMAPVLAQLGSIHHLRALTDDSSGNATQGQVRFRESLALDDNIPVGLKFAYFLWDLRKVNDAMERVENILERSDVAQTLVTYERHEELIVPQPLDREMGEQVIDFPAQSLSLFLLLLFYREARWGRLMDCVTAWLWRLADTERCDMHWSILGYALMEYQLFWEAAASFKAAAELQERAKQTTMENIAINLLIIFGQGLQMQKFAEKVVAGFA